MYCLENGFGLSTVCSLDNIRTVRAHGAVFSQLYRLNPKF